MPYVSDSPHSNNVSNLSNKSLKKTLCNDSLSRCRHATKSLCRNRWICALVCCITVFICSTPYNNWDAFVGLLYKDGVYSWHCDEKSSTLPITCEAQRTRIEPLFYFASGSEYSVGVIAGLLFDFCGPRYCGLTGIVVLVLGLVTLIVSSEALPLYILAVVLIGCSTNIVAFPGLILGNLFPLHKSHALTILMACQLGSSLVPVLINLIWSAIGPSMNLSKMLTFYTVFTVLPCGISYFLVLPRYRMNEDFFEAPVCTATPVAFESSVMSDAEDVKKRHNTATSQLDSSGKSLLTEHFNISESNGASKKGIKIRGDWSLLKKELKTLDIHLFNLYYIIQVIQFLYFQSTIERIYGSDALRLAGFIALLQIVFGIVIAFIVSYVGTLFLCVIMVFLNLTIYGSILMGFKTSILSIVLNNLGYSFIFTSKVTFLTDNYEENNIGQLVGYISLTAGCASVSMGLFSSYLSYKVWASIFITACIGCLCLLFVLWKRSEKGKRI